MEGFFGCCLKIVPITAILKERLRELSTILDIFNYVIHVNSLIKVQKNRHTTMSSLIM